MHSPESWFQYTQEHWADHNIWLILEDELLLETLVKNEKLRILDAGCGFGHLLKSIQQRSLRVESFGIDASCKMLKMGKEKLEVSSHLTCGDVMALPFNDNSFDMIISMEVIEHLPHPLTFLLEAKRVLKKGGFLIIITENRLDLTQISYKLKRETHQVAGDPTHINVLTIHELSQLFDKAEFTDVKVRAIKFWLPLFGQLKPLEKLALKMGSVPFFNLFQIGLMAVGTK